MKKNFEPKLIEKSWYQEWEKSGYFKANPNSKAQPFCIMIPPPNVTGTLHMGHGFQITLMDALIRYKRMSGFDTLWQVGTDHAGIATQMVLERKLESQGLSRKDIGREEFINKVWEWKEISRKEIARQLRKLGASVDWSREAFTMDSAMSNAVKEVFISLYEENLIYRGKKLVNWDVDLQTAVSDLEVTSEEESGLLWYLKYPLSDGEEICIATTRPETMFGDTAVAVNPEDKRYTNLIGKTVILPISDREIPIISDNYVDPKLGTGCVKITPAHDFNDFEIGERHNLPSINILNLDGTLNEQVPKEFRGLDRIKAREGIIKKMSSLQLFEKKEKHRSLVPRGDRSNSILEPLITDQWFVDVRSLSRKAIKVVKEGKTRFIPKNWEKTYFSWMENIQDWCISRQLWWGHRIPAWFDEEENIFVGRNEEEIRVKYQIPKKIKLIQAEDVLDTWFSSALWTFSTLGWPSDNTYLKRYHPTDVLVTGFDIIFFWVARMIMLTTHFISEVPFKKVFVHGLIRDAEGKKMSKSKGNILDPLDIIDGIKLDALINKRIEGLMQPKMKTLIEKQTRKTFPEGIKAFGTDALRFTFCSLASGSRDINFDMQRVEGYRNFCNKLWNAARFINIQLKNFPKLPKEESSDIVDNWIKNRLDKTLKKITSGFENYRLDLVAQSIYEFIWYEFCDWYVEISKIRLSSKAYSKKEKLSILVSIVNTFERCLQLAHPLIPFITEEIWQQMKPFSKQKDKSLMVSKYPEYQGEIFKQDELSIEWLKVVVTGIRNIRSEMQINPSLKIKALARGGTKKEIGRINVFSKMILALTGLEELTIINKEEISPASAITVHGNLEILIPLEGLIKPQYEKQRLEKKITKLDEENNFIKKQLKNKNFIEKAPKKLIKEQQIRSIGINSEKDSLTIQLKEIEKLI